MAEKLIEVTRGDIAECIHRGDIAITDNEGKLLASVGDPYKLTYFRSSAKAFQAMNVILSGAADKFNFSDAEIAIMCASHYAEKSHLETVQSILDKIGLTKENLLCGTDTSLNPEYALKLANEGAVLSPMYSDCSGKQSGMLSVCIHNNYSVHDYLDPNHACQKEIKKIIADMCSIEENEIHVGVDGCSAPVHGIPIYNMALGYARIANPENLDENYRNTSNRIFTAMNKEPFMVSGTGGFCTALIENTGGKLIGKIGAEGVFCVGVKGRNIGIAIKIEDGSMKAVAPTVVRVLEELDILTKEELLKLEKFREINNINDRKIVVGKMKPVFRL